jgi:hypothetical protein
MSIWWTNQLWAVSLDLILFLDFLKLFVEMRLAISFAWVQIHNFWTYKSKVMDVWSFLGEVWAGRPWTGANEVELIKVPKSGGRRRKERGGRKEKRGTCLWSASDCWLSASWQLAVAGQGSSSLGRPATRGHPLATAHSLTQAAAGPLFPSFFWFKKKFVSVVWRWAWHLGEWVYSTPFFWTLPLHLEGWNLPFFTEQKDFFSAFFFPKIRVDLELHIHRWDVCFMRNQNH